MKWKIKNLVLTHHEPAYTDAVLYQNKDDALAHREVTKSKSPRIILAREGTRFRL